MSSPQAGDVVGVSVKSAWLSKINWTQAVAGAAMVLAFISGGKMDLTAEQQAALVMSIGVLGNIVTWIIKTWFTPTVTPASVASPGTKPGGVIGS